MCLCVCEGEREGGRGRRECVFVHLFIIYAHIIITLAHTNIVYI